MISTICTRDAITRMNDNVCRYPKSKGLRINVWISHVTRVAKSITKATAADIPSEVFTFWLTPRKGQIPKNWLNTILFTNIAAININKYSIVILFNIMLS
jgi:hypothetical protein